MGINGLSFWRFVAVEHPVHAKFVGQHAKCGSPKGVGQRHGYFSSFGKFSKNSFDLVVILSF